MSVAVEQAGIDYHVVLAQNALQQCLDQPELQTEFICALVKQTSRHTQQRLGVQVKKAARLVSLGTARVVSPAYLFNNKIQVLCTIFFRNYYREIFRVYYFKYKMVHWTFLVKYYADIH